MDSVSVAFSPDVKRIITGIGSDDKTTRLWDIRPPAKVVALSPRNHEGSGDFWMSSTLLSTSRHSNQVRDGDWGASDGLGADFPLVSYKPLREFFQLAGCVGAQAGDDPIEEDGERENRN